MSEGDQIIENLNNSEAKLQELNGQLDVLKQDYNTMVANNDFYSFFNFDNIYFWFVLVGLILLAFGLIFLLVELQHSKSEKRENKKAKVEEIEEDEEVEDKETEEEKEIEEEKPKKTAPKKIKVIKVK